MWTGHSDGCIYVHHLRSLNVDSWQLPTGNMTSVRVLAVDGEGQVWAGYDSGQLVVLSYDPQPKRIMCRWGAGRGGAQRAVVCLRDDAPVHACLP